MRSMMNLQGFSPEQKKWYRERGWYFDAQMDEQIEWEILPWWKRLWISLTNPKYREKQRKTKKAHYVKLLTTH